MVSQADSRTTRQKVAAALNLPEADVTAEQVQIFEQVSAISNEVAALPMPWPTEWCGDGPDPARKLPSVTSEDPAESQTAPASIPPRKA